MERNQGPLVDPAAASLHILLIDANLKSRQSIEALLNSCNYQVTACKTGQEAIQVLKAQQGPSGAANFDLILKEHCPSSGTNATRFLRRAQNEALMQGIPIIVASAVEDRDVMVNCLQLGAADFMLKPLRAAELRNLWARVYWWRRATYHQPAARSQPVSLNDSRSGSGSHETRGGSYEPQEAALDEGGSGSGDGSAPGAITGGTGGSAAPRKEALGWSGTQINGNTKPLTQQCSNNPSIPSQAMLASDVPSTLPSGSAAQTQPSNTEGPKFSQLSGEFPPLDLKGGNLKPVVNQDQRPAIVGAPSGSGFRAYVASEHGQSLKRSMPELNSKEDPGSSGSDWTGSLEMADQNKRRAVMSSQDQNGNMVNGHTALSQAWLQGQQSQANLAQRSQSMPVGLPGRQSVNGHANGDGQKGEQANIQQGNASQSLPPGFPFCFVPGMMPPPFAMQALWNQSNGGKPGQSMPGMFPQFNDQQQGNGQQGSQAQQQALHNQIMYHHNLLLQQYGMVPPFMQYSGFTSAANQPHDQEAAKQANGASAPVAVVAKPQKSVMPPSSSQMFLSTRSTTPTGNMTSTTAHLPSASPSNGVQQLPIGGDSTQDTAQRPNTSGQMAVDGYMMEPSRKQRRAEALHKYKQKRKKLNFTKTIRYESRKQLAQARPRVKGQFVRTITSEDVNAVVDSLTPAQMKDVAEGKTDVADLLMENARQNADATIGTEGTERKADDTKDVEISEEDETITLNGEDDDVSSPASKGCQKPLFSADNNLPSPQKPSVPMDKSRRNSSHSGSNSPETEANLLEAFA